MSQLEHAVRRSKPRAWLAGYALLVTLATALALVRIGGAGADEGGPSPAAVSKSASTVTSKADAVDAVDLQCTSSPQFNDMPGMLVSFRLGGNASRAVIVLFQGEFGINATEGTALFIRLTIDGSPQSGPNDVIADQRPGGSAPAAETHGFNFLSDPLSPGLHVARIQWRTNTLQDCVRARSLIVLHK